MVQHVLLMQYVGWEAGQTHAPLTASHVYSDGGGGHPFLSQACGQRHRFPVPVLASHVTGPPGQKTSQQSSLLVQMLPSAWQLLRQTPGPPGFEQTCPVGQLPQMTLLPHPSL